MQKTIVVLVVAITAAIALLELVPRASAQQRGPQVRRRGAASLDAALSDPSEEKQAGRVREGVLLSDELGTFSASGERIAFTLVGQQQSMGVLENLALERVWKMLDDTRGRQWSVSGTVTEYRGRNFLLLHRAVVRARDISAKAKP